MRMFMIMIVCERYGDVYVCVHVYGYEYVYAYGYMYVDVYV